MLNGFVYGQPEYRNKHIFILDFLETLCTICKGFLCYSLTSNFLAFALTVILSWQHWHLL